MTTKISEINKMLKMLEKETNVRKGDGHSLLLKRVGGLEKETNVKKDSLKPIGKISPIERMRALKQIENAVPQTITHPSYIDKQSILTIVSKNKTVLKTYSENEETIIIFYDENTKEMLGKISSLVSERILEDINKYRNVLKLTDIEYPQHMSEELRTNLKTIFEKKEWNTICSMGINLTVESLADKIFYENIVSNIELLERSKEFKIFVAFHSIDKTSKNAITFLKYKYNFILEREL